jgi:ribosomal protein S18 acetylase RimI-like enzyme
LRAAGGFTGRANSTLVVGDPGVPIVEALAEVKRFAQAHDLPPRLQIPTGSPWYRAVAGHGWVPDTDHPAGHRVLVMVGPVAQLATPGQPPEIDTETSLTAPDDWWRVTLGGAPSSDQRQVLGGAGLAEIGFALATIDRRPVGGIRTVVLDEHLHLSRLEVAPAYRRRGVARSLLDEAARWGVGRGARWCVLQVAEDNPGAVGLYRRLGLRPHHEYEYLRPA